MPDNFLNAGIVPATSPSARLGTGSSTAWPRRARQCSIARSRSANARGAAPVSLSGSAAGPFRRSERGTWPPCRIKIRSQLLMSQAQPGRPSVTGELRRAEDLPPVRRRGGRSRSGPRAAAGSRMPIGLAGLGKQGTFRRAEPLCFRRLVPLPAAGSTVAGSTVASFTPASFTAASFTGLGGPCLAVSGFAGSRAAPYFQYSAR
jgi:hypothetical protein